MEPSGRRSLPDRRMGITTGALLQMMEQNDEKHEAGHERLRQDYRSLERRHTSAEDSLGSMQRRLDKLELAPPPELGNLRVPLPMVATIVFGFLAIGTGMWSFRSDVVNRLDQQNQGEQDCGNDHRAASRAAWISLTAPKCLHGRRPQPLNSQSLQPHDDWPTWSDQRSTV